MILQLEDIKDIKGRGERVDSDLWSSLVQSAQAKTGQRISHPSEQG